MSQTLSFTLYEDVHGFCEQKTLEKEDAGSIPSTSRWLQDRPLFTLSSTTK